MIIDKAIALVKKRLNIHTDDTTLRHPYVYEVLRMVRSELLRQESNKDYLWDGASGQLLPGVELQESSISEFLGYVAPIKVYKSVNELPEFTDTKYGKIIHNVFFDNGIRLERTEYAEWIGTRKRRYVLPGVYYFLIRNKRLYVLGYDGDEEILLNLEGIYDNPEEVELLKEGSDSYIGDLEFSIPGYISRRTIELAALHIAQEKNLPIDNRNDSTETQHP